MRGRDLVQAAIYASQRERSAPQSHQSLRSEYFLKLAVLLA